MSNLDKVALWVVDPGLMEAGGHHAALAETLCQMQQGNGAVRQKVYCHQQIDKNLCRKLEEHQISAMPFFSSVFYKHFDDGAQLGPAGLQHYVRLLASEYIAVLKQSIVDSEAQRLVLFFPCLNWEHAWALALALQQVDMTGEQANVHLVCCAMYSPQATEQNDANKALWYRMGFNRLQANSAVSLYCSDHELLHSYSALLELDTLQVHPCYLMDWPSIGQISDKKQALPLPASTYLLYMGDAKSSKGFNRLPNLITQALANTPAETHFLVQYTLAWAYPELDNTLATLKRMAANEPRLILRNEFWQNHEMVLVMQQIHGAVCTYDTDVYQNKSSGLLWMLAYFNRPFMVDGPCWLTREAQRLGLAYKISETLSVADMLSLNPRLTAGSSLYRERLFCSLNHWLVNH